LPLAETFIQLEAFLPGGTTFFIRAVAWVFNSVMSKLSLQNHLNCLNQSGKLRLIPCSRPAHAQIVNTYPRPPETRITVFLGKSHPGCIDVADDPFPVNYSNVGVKGIQYLLKGWRVHQRSSLNAM